MSYFIGLLALTALAICIVTFPIPTLLALLGTVAWWLVKGRKRSVR